LGFIANSKKIREMAQKSVFPLLVIDHSTAWITGPTNVRARRVAPTALEVSWDRPPYDSILGYRIYYDVYPEKEMEQWETTEVFSIYLFIYL